MGCLGPDHYETKGEAVAVVQRQIGKLEAMLCGLLSVVTKNSVRYHELLGQVDWEEAGVSRSEFESWWGQHQAEDLKRKAAEDLLKLPAGPYKVKDQVHWQSRDWIVRAVVEANGVTMVKMVTFDEGPARSETVKVKK